MDQENRQNTFTVSLPKSTSGPAVSVSMPMEFSLTGTVEVCTSSMTDKINQLTSQRVQKIDQAVAELIQVEGVVGVLQFVEVCERIGIDTEVVFEEYKRALNLRSQVMNAF